MGSPLRIDRASTGCPTPVVHAFSTQLPAPGRSRNELGVKKFVMQFIYDRDGLLYGRADRTPTSEGIFMTSEPSVRCPECSERFDSTYADGWCTNLDCGDYRHGDHGEMSERPSCATCGVTAKIDDKHCRDCGERLPELCPSCGARAEAGDSYCRGCGEKLGYANVTIRTLRK